jgi:hypothetical protein
MTSIISTGDHLPSIRVLKACKVADETFTQKIELDISDLPAAPRGYSYSLETAIALKITGPVDPHSDEFMGLGKPDNSIGMFWLVKEAEAICGHLMVEGESTRMKTGSYAFFKDTRLHAFIARKTWVGIAVQLRQR